MVYTPSSYPGEASVDTVSNAAKTGLGFASAKRNFVYQLGVNPYSQYQPLQDALGEVARASLADSRNAAEEMRDWVELLATYHELVMPASKLVVISSTPFIVDKKNRAEEILRTE